MLKTDRTSNRRIRDQRKRKRSRMRFELLEQRQLLAGDLLAPSVADISTALETGFQAASADLPARFAADSSDQSRNVPLIPSDVETLFGLEQAITDGLPVFDASQVSSMSDLVSVLTTAGFSVHQAIDDASLAGLAADQKADFIRVSKTVDFSESRSVVNPDLSVITEQNLLEDMTASSSFMANFSGTFVITFGVDSDGFYLLPQQGLVSMLEVSGQSVSSVNDGITKAATVILNADLETNLTASSPSEVIRLDDLANQGLIEGQLHGTVGTDVQFQKDLGSLGTIPLDAHWQWDFHSQQSAALNSALSSFNTDGFQSELIERVSQNLGALTHAIGVTVDGQVDVPLLDHGVDAALAAQFSNSFTADSGFAPDSVTVSAIADPESFLNGTLGSDQLIEIHVAVDAHQASGQTVQVADQTADAIPGTIAIDFTSSVEFSPSISADLVFGYDVVAGAYVLEGSSLTGRENLNADLMGATLFGASIEATVSGGYGSIFEAGLTVEDGDGVPSERFYLAPPPATGVESEVRLQLSSSSQAHVDALSFELDLSSTPGDLPRINVSSDVQLDATPERLALEFADDVILNAAAEAMLFGVNEFSDQLRDLGTLFQEFRYFGDPLSEVIGETFRENSGSAGSITGDARPFFQSLGFTIEEAGVASIDDLFAGTFGNKPLLQLTYSTAGPLDADALSKEGTVASGPLNVKGDLSVEPTIGATFSVGIDTIGGVYLREGASFDASAVVTGTLTGSANLGRITGLASSAAVNGNFGASVVLDDRDAESGERFYLIGTPTTQATGVRSILDTAAVQFPTNALTVDATISMDSPLDQLGLSQYLFEDVVEALPPGLRNPLQLNASIDVDVVNGNIEIDVDRRSIDDFLALFGDDAKATFRRAFVRALVKKLSGDSSPIPEEIREIVNFELPVFGTKLKTLLDIPPEADLLLDPDAWQENHSEDAESDPEATHENFEFSFDLFNTTNLENLLLGRSTFDLASVRIRQEYAPEFAEIILKPETQFVSYMGILNGSYEVTMNPVVEFKADVTIGIDTDGFYVREGSIVDTNINLIGGLQGNLKIDGEIGPLDLVRGTGSASIVADLGLYFSDPEGPDGDGKLRELEFAQARNQRVDPALKLILDLTVDAGFEETGVTEELAKEQREIILWRGEGGTVADIGNELEGYKETLERRADIVACQIAANTRDWFSTAACGQQIIDDPIGFIDGFINGNLDPLEQHLKDLEVLYRDVESLLGNAFDDLDRRALRYADEVLDRLDQGGLLLDVLGLSILDGNGTVTGLLGDLVGGSLKKVPVQPRPTFDHTLQDRVLRIAGWDSEAALEHFGVEGADLTIDVRDGKLIVDAPNYVRRNVLVAKKKKYSWSEEEKIRKDIEDTNSLIFDIGEVQTIIVEGTDFADTILATDNVFASVQISAGGGDDLLSGGGGTSWINGGTGSDIITGALGIDIIDGGTGDDIIDGRRGDDVIRGGSGDDKIEGGEGNDRIDAGSGSNIVQGGDGNDQIEAGNGEDTLRGNDGNDFVRGGGGDDSLFGDDGEDRIDGGDGDDLIIGGAGDDELRGNEGEDTIFGDRRDGGGGGQDQLFGNNGDDLLFGGTGDDVIIGGRGDDGIRGGAGDDELIGDDRLRSPDTWLFDTTPLGEFTGVHVANLEFDDFNDDGIPDVASTIYDNSVNFGKHTLTVQIGLGDGTFTESFRVDVAGGNQPHGIATGDFNGDGTVDVSVALPDARFTGELARVFLNRGDATFASGLTISGSESVSNMTTHDVTGDGILDLVFAEDRAITLRAGNGDGTFDAREILASTPNSSTFFGGSNSGMYLRDLNNDGHQDIITGGQNSIDFWTSDAYAYVAYGQGNGTFGEVVAFPLSTDTNGINSVVSLKVNDLNNDGYFDLAAQVHTGLSKLVVRYGNEFGSFAEPIVRFLPYELKHNNELAIGDLNGDGLSDVVLSGSQPNSRGYADTERYSVLTQQNDGSFSESRFDLYPLGAYPGQSELRDFDGDGTLDLFLGPKLLRGNGDGEFIHRTQNPAFASWANSRLTVDFNSDGQTDFAYRYINGSIDRLMVSISNPDGSYRQTNLGSTGGGTYRIASGDFNGDGNQDLYDSWRSRIFFGDGTGGFSEQIATRVTLLLDQGDFSVGDFNNDGLDDLIGIDYASSYRYELSVRLSQGDGTFIKSSVVDTIALREGFLRTRTADVNNDGNMDFLFADVHGGWLRLYLGDDSGNLTESDTLYAFVPGDNEELNGFEVVDLDRDGDLEVAMYGYTRSGSVLQVWQVDQTGIFSTESDFQSDLPQFRYPDRSLDKGDFNGDGYTDLILLHYEYRVFPGTGDSRLLFAGSQYGSSSNVWGSIRDVRVSDIDNDGDLDVLAQGRYAEVYIEGLRDGESWRLPGVAYPESSKDKISGGPGRDWIDGGPDDDVISGDDGLDIIHGDLGNDLIRGGKGNDQLFGGDGNDQIEGSSGSDVILGGDGDDILVASLNTGPRVDSSSDSSSPEGTIDSFATESGADIRGGAGNDSIYGSFGSDVIWAGEGDDFVVGSLGDDEIRGGSGSDTIYGDFQSDGSVNPDAETDFTFDDVIYGGGQNDPFEVEDDPGIDTDQNAIVGGPGGDEIFLGHLGDQAFAEAGDDQVSGGNGADFIDAGDGNDQVDAAAGDDIVAGGLGNDRIHGGEGNDTLNGDAGADDLIGAFGDDIIDGGEGADLIWGGEEAFSRQEMLDAGFESDGFTPRLVADPSYLVAIAGDPGDGQDKLTAGPSGDWLFGGGQADLLIGSVREDYLHDGNDGDIFEPDPSDGFEVAAQGPSLGVPGQPLDFLFSVTNTDPGTAYLYSVDWDGDGNLDQSALGQDSITLQHAFSTVGDFNIGVTVTPLNNQSPQQLTFAVVIDHVVMQESDLYVGAGGEDNTIEINKGSIIVIVDGQDLGRYEPTGKVVVFAGGGNDIVVIDPAVDLPVEVYGGDGDDELRAGNGPTTLYGELGDDTLIGGLGSSRLVGGPGDDTLIDRGGTNSLVPGLGKNRFVAGGGTNHFEADPIDGTDQADPPQLMVPDQIDATETRSIPLWVLAALSDPAGEELSIIVSGVPSDAVLSAGTRNEDSGFWTLSPNELTGLSIDNLDDGLVELVVTAVATETANQTKASVSAMIPITVTNVDPIIETVLLDQVKILENGVVELSGRFTDPGTIDRHQLGIDWGDGSSPTIVNLPSGERSFAAWHRYLDQPTGNGDTFTIHVTLRDDDGGSDSATTTVDVLNAQPDVETFSIDHVSINENGEVTATGSLRDAGWLDIHEVEIDWGDGATSMATVDGPVELADDSFALSDWDLETVAYGRGGTAVATQETGSDPRRRIDFSLNDPPEGGFSQVATFSAFGSSLDPTGKGGLAAIDFRWDSFDLSIAPADERTLKAALRQGGQWFATKPFGIEANGRSRRFLESDFFLEGNPGVHPNFSATGLPIEFGYFVQTLVRSGNPARDFAVAIDNWQVTAYPATDQRTFTATHRYLDDDPSGTAADDYQITASVSDDDGGTGIGTTTVTVHNTSPTLLIDPITVGTPDDPAKPGDTVTFGGSFTDLGTLDSHTLIIDWGEIDDQADDAADDRTVIEFSADDLRDFSASHSFATGGLFTVTVTVIDDDSGWTSDASTEIWVSGVRLDPNSGVLQVIGTVGDDKVDVKGVINGKEEFVNAKGKFDQQGLDQAFDLDYPTAILNGIVILLGSGDDNAHVHKTIDVDALIDGGAGRDKIKGGRGNDTLIGGGGDDDLKGNDGDDLLIGGTGDDKLNGGKGRDILIGGDGDDDLKGGSDGGDDGVGDVLSGGDGDDKLKGGSGKSVLIGGDGLDELHGHSASGDLFIGGWTAHDEDPVKLGEVHDIWSSGNSYADIVQDLTGSGDLLEIGVTVFGDDDEDRLDSHGKAADLFFAEMGLDRIKGNEDDKVLLA